MNKQLAIVRASVTSALVAGFTVVLLLIATNYVDGSVEDVLDVLCSEDCSGINAVRGGFFYVGFIATIAAPVALFCSFLSWEWRPISPARTLISCVIAITALSLLITLFVWADESSRSTHTDSPVPIAATFASFFALLTLLLGPAAAVWWGLLGRTLTIGWSGRDR